MKVINPNRFNVEIGSSIAYNSKAIDWMNSDLRSRGKDLWPTAKELNKRNPRVVHLKTHKNLLSREKYIEIWVEHDDGYTGLSGVVDKQFEADIWFLNSDGTFLDSCKFPLFIKEKK